ncbi:acyl-coenzyme A synthetase ACSM3, mitochondrial-like [Glandiceps talaboti]
MAHLVKSLLPHVLRTRLRTYELYGCIKYHQRIISMSKRSVTTASSHLHGNKHHPISEHQLLSTQHTLPFQPCRTFLSAISSNGFNDYELGRKNFKLEVPEYYNFAHDVIDAWAEKEQTGKRRGKLPAFWWIDDNGNELKWTFQDLSAKSKKVANLLTKDCGVKRLDKLIVVLPRIPEWWLINVACVRAGIVLSPGTTQLTKNDIRSRIQNSHASCIITDSSCADAVDQVAAECPQLTTKLFVSQDGKERPGWFDFNSLYSKASEEHECVQTRADETMTVFFTSGTTQQPKMAEHTHASYGLAHVITGKFWLDLTPTDLMWSTSDTGWAKAAWSNLFATWNMGSCVFIHHTTNIKFNPNKTLEILDKYPITTFCAPPTAFRLFVQEDLSKYNLQSLRHTVSAGEPLNPEVIDEWRAATGQIIREGYGQTETVLLCGSFRCLQPRPGSFGKPAPGYDVRIVDDEGNEVEDGMEGNIAVKVKPVKPVGLFKGYVDDPERTAASFVGDYYLAGDRGIRDEDGYFWFVGRADDVILSSGYRIGPFEVESALLEHDAVMESAVVSSPDPIRGVVVKAFVVLAKDYKLDDQEALIKELQNHVKETTAPYKYPRKMEFVESLPKTVSGKIRRVELRDREHGRTT